MLYRAKIFSIIIYFSLMFPLFAASYVDQHGHVCVDGEPIFIKGFFSDSYTSSLVEKLTTIDSMAVGGFNVIKSNASGDSSAIITHLNYAETSGILMLYDGAQNNEWKDYHLNVMNTYKDHPTLLGWYIADDSHGIHPDSLKVAYDRAKAIDSNHFTTHSMALSCWNDYDAEHILERIDYCEVLQMQSYPIGKEAIDEVYRDLRKTVTTVEDHQKAVVADLQLFDWHLTGHEWGRWPTSKEVELMTWLAIAAGVDGYLYYTYYDRLPPSPLPLSSSQPELWRSAKTVSQNVDAIVGDILHCESFISKNPVQNLYYAIWETEAYSTVLVINTSSHHKINFSIPINDMAIELESLMAQSADTLFLDRQKLKGTLPPFSHQVCRVYHTQTSISFLNNVDHISTQASPNPFNPTTTISYELPEAQDIKLQIFDILGRLVETLYEGYKESGYWDVTWDARDQSSGVYIYSLQYGENCISKKMLLLK